MNNNKNITFLVSALVITASCQLRGGQYQSLKHSALGRLLLPLVPRRQETKKVRFLPGTAALKTCKYPKALNRAVIT